MSSGGNILGTCYASRLAMLSLHRSHLSLSPFLQRPRGQMSASVYMPLPTSPHVKHDCQECCLMRCEENKEVGAFVKCTDDISGLVGVLGRAAGITRAVYLSPHSSAVLPQWYLEPCEAIAKSLSLPQAPYAL